MQDDQKKIVDQIWARRASNLPIHSPYELVTLASIVEKETGKADERPRVASVFMNRLTKHMRLQSDPTIVYGLVGGKGTLGRGITRSELDKPTPYNTYTIDGLPPGPIANPGRAALEATANPSRTQDLYFRRRWNWRPCLRRNARPAFAQRAALARDRERRERQAGATAAWSWTNPRRKFPRCQSSRRRPEKRQRNAVVGLWIASSIAPRPATRAPASPSLSYARPRRRLRKQCGFHLPRPSR